MGFVIQLFLLIHSLYNSHPYFFYLVVHSPLVSITPAAGTRITLFSDSDCQGWKIVDNVMTSFTISGAVVTVPRSARVCSTEKGGIAQCH